MLHEVSLSMSLESGVPAPSPEPPEAGSPEPALRSGVVQSEPLRRPVMSRAQRDAILTELLHLHYSTVWRTLRRLGIEADRVDDAAQEVFIVASRKLENIEPGRERNYLLSSAIRIAANFRRASRARHEVLDERAIEGETDPVPDADQLLDRKRLREVLDQVLAGWPAEVRTAFVLFELEGLSVPEIAELTETKVGTVASRLRRARELFLLAVKRLKARGVVSGGAP